MCAQLNPRLKGENGSKDEWERREEGERKGGKKRKERREEEKKRKGAKVGRWEEFDDPERNSRTASEKK